MKSLNMTNYSPVIPEANGTLDNEIALNDRFIGSKSSVENMFELRLDRFE